jgi:hypothetical protein
MNGYAALECPWIDKRFWTRRIVSTAPTARTAGGRVDAGSDILDTSRLTSCSPAKVPTLGPFLNEAVEAYAHRKAPVSAAADVGSVSADAVTGFVRQPSLFSRQAVGGIGLVNKGCRGTASQDAMSEILTVCQRLLYPQRD